MKKKFITLFLSSVFTGGLAAGYQASSAEDINDFSGAKPFFIDTVINGHLGEANKQDIYILNIPPGNSDGLLRFSIDKSNYDYSPHVTLFNHSQAEKEKRFVSRRTPVDWTVPVTAGQKYYFKIDTDYYDTDYSARVSFDPVNDGFEPNNSYETAKELKNGQPVDLLLFSGHDTHKGKDSDYDTFKINVPAGKKQLKVKVLNHSTENEPQTVNLAVYSKDRVRLNDYFGLQRTDLDLLVPVTEAGIYYLKFSGNNSVIPNKLIIGFE